VELIVSRLSQIYEGIKVSLVNGENILTLAIINGNQSDYTGPVILLGIDAHTLYGLSKPEIISRILTKGPQTLLTTKDMAHNLFEHGLKSFLGKIKIKNNWFTTTLDTYYTAATQMHLFQAIQGRDGSVGCLFTPDCCEKSILFCNCGFEIKDATRLNNTISNIVEIDKIRTYISIPLD